MIRTATTKRRCPGCVRQGGYTLLEIMVATGIATVVTLAGLALTKVGADSAAMLASTQRSDGEMERALRQASDRLKSASIAATSITEGTQHDVLSLQVIDPTDTSTTPAVGYWDTSNQFQPNWSGQYRVDGTDLIHRVLNASGTVIQDTVICTHVEPRVSSGVITEKAFQVTRSGELVTLSLHVEWVLKDGKMLERSEWTSVRQQNP